MKAQEFGYRANKSAQVVPLTCEYEGTKGVLTYRRRQEMRKLEPGDPLVLPCVYPGAAGQVLESNYRDLKGQLSEEEKKDGHGTILFILFDELSARILIEQQTKY